MNLETINKSSINKLQREIDDLEEVGVDLDIDVLIGNKKLKLLSFYFRKYNLSLMKRMSNIKDGVDGSFESILIPYLVVSEKTRQGNETIEKKYTLQNNFLKKLPINVVNWYSLNYLVKSSEVDKIKVTLTDYDKKDLEKNKNKEIILLPPDEVNAYIKVSDIKKNFDEKHLNVEIIDLPEPIRYLEKEYKRIAIPPVTFSSFKSISKYSKEISLLSKEQDEASAVTRSQLMLNWEKMVNTTDVFILDDKGAVDENLSEADIERICEGFHITLINKINKIKKEKIKKDFLKDEGEIDILNKEGDIEKYKTNFYYELPLPFFFFTTNTTE